jgi:hypothetical protein
MLFFSEFTKKRPKISNYSLQNKCQLLSNHKYQLDMTIK